MKKAGRVPRQDLLFPHKGENMTCSRSFGRALLTLAALLTIVSSAAAEDANVEAARKAIAKIKPEYTKAYAKFNVEMRKIRTSDEYKAAMKERDFKALNGMMMDIVKPFQEKWQTQFNDVYKQFEGKSGELVLV